MNGNFLRLSGPLCACTACLSWKCGLRFVPKNSQGGSERVPHRSNTKYKPNARTCDRNRNSLLLCTQFKKMTGSGSLARFLIQLFLILPRLRCIQQQSEKGRENQVYRLGAIFDTENHPRLEAALQEAIRSLNEDDVEDIEDETVEFEAVVRYLNGSKPFEAVDVTCELLEEGVVGILGPLSEQNSNVVQSVCDFKEIPHIEVRWDDHMTDAIINVHPYPDTLTKTYYDLITSWGWRHFVILYENDESLQRVGELLKLFGEETVIVVRQLDPHGISDYRPTFKEVRDFGGTHFVLDCSIKILNEVLVQAQQVGLMTDKHHFIITNLDLHTLDLAPYQHSKTNITAMRFVDPEDEYLKRTVCNMRSVSETDCSSISNPLIGFEIRLEEALTFDAVKMFGSAVRSIRPMVKPVPLDCYNDADRFRSGTTIINTVKTMDYPGITGNIRFDIKGVRSDFALDVMELKEDGQSVVGTWSTKKTPALNISRPSPKLDSEMLDIKNQTFKVIITLTEPYGMRVESLEPLYGNDQYEGFGIDLIKELSAMRGFNYTFIVREDKKNGEYDNKTGKWTGIIGDLIDGRADLAIADLTITLEREEAVDFTSPFMMLGISILYKKPTKAPPSFFSFADPFAFEVWQFLVIAWIGVSLLLFVVGRISPGEWENPYPCIKEPEYLVNQLDLRNCFWFVTGSIMQQGSEIELKSPPTRMVAGMWWFFTLLMVSSYTANLAAFLTTENPDPHFSNFHELVTNAETKRIKYGAKKGGATVNFFRLVGLFERT
ncbi:unnamed protein product [Acanthoscelides obtectus]|uniref:Uncharacterized protein n=1 Tax=Acanthoscelides obtectus TaxID=200917 RepID=A0A9P0M4I5_ACAOB|nr:unnamed protein product [Acanthoscelides obtectus]CAK1670400.1 Glutamate receptor ionotropic, kainate 2 [Acanthoscelides obtectus]